MSNYLSTLEEGQILSIMVDGIVYSGTVEFVRTNKFGPEATHLNSVMLKDVIKSKKDEAVVRKITKETYITTIMVESSEESAEETMSIQDAFAIYEGHQNDAQS